MSDNVVMTAMNYDSNRPAAANPVKIMDLSLRDGHQSLFATRGRTEDMIPVAEMMAGRRLIQLRAFSNAR